MIDGKHNNLVLWSKLKKEYNDVISSLGVLCVTAFYLGAQDFLKGF